MQPPWRQTVQSSRKLAACFKWDSRNKEHKSWKNYIKCSNANNLQVENMKEMVKKMVESEKTRLGQPG